MKLDKLIQELRHIQAEYDNIEVVLQNNPQLPGDGITSYESFFIVPEEYEGGEVRCNIRIWPY